MHLLCSSYERKLINLNSVLASKNWLVVVELEDLERSVDAKVINSEVAALVEEFENYKCFRFVACLTNDYAGFKELNRVFEKTEYLPSMLDLEKFTELFIEARQKFFQPELVEYVQDFIPP